MHRDLKPENLLLSKNGEVKISDFGFSKMLSPDLAATYCGSPYYTAPEILRGTPYVVNAADIWSLGIVLYSMLTGCLPFNGKNVADLLDRITRKKFQVPDYLLPSEVDLLHRLLEVDASKRITLDELLEHEWVIAGPDGTTVPVSLHLNEFPPVAEPDMGLVGQLAELADLPKENIAQDIINGVSSSPARLYHLSMARPARPPVKVWSTDALDRLSNVPTPVMSTSVSPQTPELQSTPSESALRIRPGLDGVFGASEGNMSATSLGKDSKDGAAAEKEDAARMARRASEPVKNTSARRKKLTLLHHLPFYPARSTTTATRAQLVDLLKAGAEAKDAGFVIDSQPDEGTIIVRDTSEECVMEVSLRQGDGGAVDVLVRRRRGAFSKHRLLNDRVMEAMRL